MDRLSKPPESGEFWLGGRLLGLSGRSMEVSHASVMCEVPDVSGISSPLRAHSCHERFVEAGIGRMGIAALPLQFRGNKQLFLSNSPQAQDMTAFAIARPSAFELAWQIPNLE